MAGHKRLATDLLTLAGFSAFLFFWGLGSFGLIGADEPRYAQVAREMLERGDWVTPYLYGQPWLEKPILYYWRTIVAYKIFGVGDWQARLAAATFATAMVFAIYIFLRRFRPGAELDGALVTAASVAVIGFARGAGTDMQISAPYAVGMLAWYAWFAGGRRLWLAAFFVLMALGTLAKGPVAPVLAGLTIVAYAALRREWRLVLRTLWLPGILLFLAVALPWYIAVQLRNPEFFRVFILEHNLARMASDVFRHVQPFWYYLPVLLLGLLPWTIPALAGVVTVIRRPEEAENRDLPLFLLLWGLVPVVFFSLSQSKLPGYILPGIPAFTMLAAEWLRRQLEAGKRPGWTLCVAHSLTAGVMLGAVVLYPQLYAWKRLGAGLSTRALGIGIALTLVVALGMVITLRRQGLRILRFLTLVPVILGVGFIIRTGAPVIDATQSARPVAREIARIETKRFPVAVFQASRHVEYGLAFYRNRPVVRYGRDPVPQQAHLVVAPEGFRDELEQQVGGRRVVRVGGFPPQGLEYFWVSGPQEVHHPSR